MSYQLPQVLVFQEYSRVPSELTEPLRACVVGSHAYLQRYGVAAEKGFGALGAYNSASDVLYPWPGKPEAATTDLSYTKLFIDDALLPYYSDLIGVGSAVAPVGASAPNQIRAADSSGGFKVHGASHPRYAALYDRDVQVGDAVHVRGVVSSTTYTLDSYVQDILSTGTDRVAAVVGTPAADDVNPATQSVGVTITAASGNTNNSTVAASAAAYKPYPLGLISDTYTVTVIASEVSSDPTTARLSVVSASGLDDVPSVAPGADGVAFAIGTLGLTMTITKNNTTPQPLVAGQVWTVQGRAAHVKPTPAAGGTFTGTSATTYVLTVTRGGYFAALNAIDQPTLTVTTTTGVDAAGPLLITSNSDAYPIGSQGVTFTVGASGNPTGLRLGDKYYITVTPVAAGAFRTLVLGHSLPAQLLTATDLDLTLSIRRDLQISQSRTGYEPLTNWDQDEDSLTVRSGIVAYDSTFTNLGVPVALQVASGQLYVEYRAWRSDLAASLSGISDVGLLDSTISGPISPDNPLKQGVYSALLNSNGSVVKFIAVADPSSLNSWSDAIGPLVGVTGVYNLVPLTQDPAVLSLFVAHVNNQSGPEAGRWRAMFLSLPLVTTKAVVTAESTADGQLALVTVADDPGAAGTQYTLVTAAANNTNFLANGVRPGDRLRLNYSISGGNVTYNEYVIARVLSENTLILSAGPSGAISVATKAEVWRRLTKDEQAADIGHRAGAYGNRRVVAVWPDLVDIGSTSLPGYHLCAALAGLISGVVPHQGLTNVTLSGFTGVPRASTYFNGDQLNTMAASGVWIVTQSPAGAIYTRDALTTDGSDLNASQEMVRRNVDAISAVFLNRLQPFIGVMNVTPSAIARLHTEICAIIDYLKNAGYTDLLGPQLIDGSILELRKHALLADRVVAVLQLTVPYSLNTIECHLVI